MTDRELLELSAKAAGYAVTDRELLEYAAKAAFGGKNFIGDMRWNPLTDDGDALRLAVKLKLNVSLEYSPTYHYAYSDEYEALSGLNCCCTKGEDCNNDPYSATRRAIVRAAAEIGKEMPCAT